MRARVMIQSGDDNGRIILGSFPATVRTSELTNRSGNGRESG